MTIASILIFGSITLIPTGGTVLDHSASVAAAVGRRAVEVAWCAQPGHPPADPAAPSFLLDEDEDDTFDDVPPDSGLTFALHPLPLASAGPLAGHGPRRVTSRSSAPTLRLRC